MIQKLNEMTPPDSYHRPNDKWVDVPVVTVINGAETKTVVVKRRSLRSKRQIFTLACTAFTLGTLIILFNSPYSKEFIVPGPLSSNHAQILAGQGADRCAACHADADGSMTGWIASSISMGHKAGLSQAELCMKCHDKSLAAGFATNPHNVSPEALAKLTAKVSDVSFDAGMGFSAPVHGNEIACSACHREHHGANHDLAAITDSQCQSCHKNNFHSFATDHPEFVNYPLKQRSGIAFDHASHFGKHFPASNSTFNCNQCHVDDDFQNVKKLASFEQACSSCHNQQVIESSQQGLAFIALPMIDTKAIEDNKLKIGSWPMAGTGDFDGVIPPVMRMLLMADSEAAEILNRRGAGFEFGDIDPEEASEVKDAVGLVWATKRLLFDLALNGASAVRSRLEIATSENVDDSELNTMMSGLDEVVFQNAVRRWLPNLSLELATMKTVVKPDDESQGKPLKEIAVKKEKVAWWPSDELLYRKRVDDQELAANPLAGLIEPLGQTGETNASEAPQDEEPTLVVRDSGGNPSLSPHENSSEVQQLELKKVDSQPPSNSELLAVNPLQQLAKTGSISPPPTALEMASDQNSNAPGAENQDSNSVGTGQALNPPRIKGFDSRTPFVTNSSLTDGLPAFVSGWFRNDETFKITYKPSGHSDDCLQSWIDFAASSDNEDHESKGQLFKQLMQPTSVGMCRSCHTVDQAADSLQVNWQAKYRDPSVRAFTRFAHGPHVIQANLQDCSHCHSLDPELSNADTFLSSDPSIAISNFHPMTKSNCASCHGENKTSSGCTQCHNYHVGSRVSGTK